MPGLAPLVRAMRCEPCERRCRRASRPLSADRRRRALALPAQCPHSARTVPAQCPR